MDEQGFKKLLDESLSPIKKDLQGVKNDLQGVKEDVTDIKDTLKDHTRRLEALSGDIEQLHSKECIIRGTKEKLMRLKNI